MAGGDLGEGERRGKVGGATLGPDHAVASRTNDAALQAVADRVVRTSKADATLARPRPTKFGAATYTHNAVDVRPLRLINYTSISTVHSLLGPKGFKLLREMGREHLHPASDPTRDLDTLVRLYRDWTRAMYPRFQFRDTLDKIERHCRTASMRVQGCSGTIV